MILIVSQYSDFATTQVIDWLLFYGKRFIRINGDSDYKFIRISDDQILIEKGGEYWDLLKCNKYWYRRDGISSLQLNTNLGKIFQSDLLQCMKNSIVNEVKTLKTHIYTKIETKIGNRCIGRFATRSMNKLDILDEARKIGLLVPSSIILTSKKQLEDLLKKENVITKAVSESIYDSDENCRYISFTTSISSEKLSSVPLKFMASLFQKNIEKKYELRIFYLKRKFYTSVVFSQENSDGGTDCRRNQHSRYLPYQLPSGIERKLHKLMKNVKLETGSIDMIVDRDDNYIFLEVNPVGQFVAYGELCNYYLDREMAKIL